MCKTVLVIDLGPLPTSGPIKGDSRTKFKTFFERKKNYDIKILSNTPSIKQCNHLLFCIVYQSIFRQRAASIRGFSVCLCVCGQPIFDRFDWLSNSQ